MLNLTESPDTPGYRCKYRPGTLPYLGQARPGILPTLTLGDAFTIRADGNPPPAVCVAWALYYVHLADVHWMLLYTHCRQSGSPAADERRELHARSRVCGDPNEIAAIDWRLALLCRAMSVAEEARKHV
jgi:hypothetical protein